MASQQPYIRTRKLILSMILTALTALPLLAFAENDTALAGAEAHIYHVYCQNFPYHTQVQKGYGLVLAAIKTNGYVTQTLIFSAQLSKIRSLCDTPWDSSYQKRRVDVDNFDPAVGGDIVSLSEPTRGI
jgi:hypothetical protein